jgi:uncharacterized lipoprotein YmbA
VSEALQVRVRDVEVAAYLQSKSLVVRLGRSEVAFAEFHRWAEPLDLGIARVLAEDLNELGGGRLAVRRNGGEAPDLEISLRVLACEGVKEGEDRASSSFAAAWEARWAKGPDAGSVRRHHYRPAPGAWDGSDYALLAERLSDALAGLAREMAGAMSRE